MVGPIPFSPLLSGAADLALEEMGLSWLPVTRHWRLNERHYGALQGLNKAETAAEHGDEQVHVWRRSYDVPPRALQPSPRRIHLGLGAAGAEPFLSVAINEVLTYPTGVGDDTQDFVELVNLSDEPIDITSDRMVAGRVILSRES